MAVESSGRNTMLRDATRSSSDSRGLGQAQRGMGRGVCQNVVELVGHHSPQSHAEGVLAVLLVRAQIGQGLSHLVALHLAERQHASVYYPGRTQGIGFA